MQLVAYGAQDVFLTGNPQITFFKIVYRRHTNFAIESIEQTFTGNADFGRKVTCTIARSGDLITKMYLRVVLPSYNSNPSGNPSNEGEWAWVGRLGHVLIFSVELEIGGTRIDKQYGDWLNIWYELARNWAQDRGYAIMIGDTPELTNFSQTKNGAILYVPLKFFSNRHDGLAIPLIALQYHETKINIEFRQRSQCVNTWGSPNMNTLSLSDASLFVDYIYLDAEERKRFAQAQHEYLIEQLQFTGDESISSVSQKFRLNFNHPCKSLYWALKLNKYVTNTPYLAYSDNDFEDAKIRATRRFVLACARYDNNGKLVLGQSGEVLPAVGLPANLLSIYSTLHPISLSAEPEVYNISTLGELLKVSDMSLSTDVLFSNWHRDVKVPATYTNAQGEHQNQGSAFFDVNVNVWHNYGLFLDKSVNPVTSVLLTLNGHDRFSQRDGSYFNYVQPYQCHSNTPADGVNMYSFALNPEDHQPSGTCNFSRIDNATLNLNFGNPNEPNNSAYNASFFNDSNIAIYATNYNVLRIMSGMGGLAYSN
jgi:hypothetical protein